MLDVSYAFTSHTHHAKQNSHDNSDKKVQIICIMCLRLHGKLKEGGGI